MKTVGVFYGSSSGNTESVAKLIADKLGVDRKHVVDVSKASSGQLENYDVLFFGSSTWGVGDLQDDWDDFIGQLKKTDLSGKEVAVFGTGDSSSYSDSFCDAIGIIVKAAEARGAKIVGQGVDTSDYSYDSSESEKDGSFCGLPLDEDNESEKTGERVSRWLEQVKKECGL